MRGARTPIIIKNMVPAFANSSAEKEGIWKNGGTETTVFGSIHQKSSEDVDEGTTGQLSEERNILCRVPLDADITYGDQIIIENFHPVINGTYEIDALLYTRTHVRAECRRTMR
jgi:hypothetical protein